MIRLYDYLSSGNGYKVRLLLTLLGIPFERVELDIVKGETKTPEFLEKNPNGRIPLLQTEEGKFLAESNAILFYLAEGTSYLPTDPFERAQVIQWMFFEQYSHEPNIATVRHRVMHLGVSEEQRQVLAEKRKQGYAALQVMEKQLQSHKFFVAERYSIADIALYAYTHVAPQGGFELESFAAIHAWLDRVSQQPGHIPITQG